MKCPGCGITLGRTEATTEKYKADFKTYKLLRRFCWGSDADFTNDDCNRHLLKLVDGSVRTLVFIDPFGYGVPAIRRDVVLKLSEIPNTDLLINFTWRIAKEMGFARRYLNCTINNRPSPSNAYIRYGSCNNCSNRKKAISYAESLDLWWGAREWLEWGSMTAAEYAKNMQLLYET